MKPLMRDLTEIKESGKLIALTDFSSSSYFIYKGVPMGFEYDLLERFADHVGVELSIQIVQDMDHVMDSLSHGQGDLIAANFTVTQRRKNKVLYLEPILETRQVLIQKMPENYWKMTQDRLDKALVRDISGLIGKTI
ncbi:MAG: transporter substrate-binding domain-containing protein, partial [Flavobacteriales bacterium]|nr:transporter substrate-binding domain-containing protein [Flavobacteriales bacterium]